MRADDIAGTGDEALVVLVAKANIGDREALAELSECLSDSERWLALQACNGEARTAWVRLVAGDDTDRQLALEDDLVQAATKLLRPGAGPLQVLLAERAALARFRLEYLKNKAEVEEQTGSLTELPARVGRMIKKAERELDRAVRSLQNIQRLIPSNTFGS